MISPKLLMTLSAATFAAMGMACLFLPEELAAAAGLPAGAALPIQLFAAGLLGFAALDWLGRSAVYGGIYGRPIVVANFGFGMITAFSLVHATSDGLIGSFGWFVAALFAIHSLSFFLTMRTHPGT